MRGRAGGWAGGRRQLAGLVEQGTPAAPAQAGACGGRFPQGAPPCTPQGTPPCAPQGALGRTRAQELHGGAVQQREQVHGLEAEAGGGGVGRAVGRAAVKAQRLRVGV